MKRLAVVVLILALCGSFLLPAQAEITKSAPASTHTYGSSKAPGAELAQTISLITGVAISPLLGASAVGAWKYFEAKPEARAGLPWFAQPWFWVTGLILVTACFLKDTIGITVPTVLKKPLDVADTIEHKISGLVATGAFVPLVVPMFKAAAPEAHLLSEAGFATADLSWLYNVIMIPISMAAFFIVFLASNAINILILLSPFTTLDAALKGFRLLVLASVTATAFANPWVGAAWSLMIIVIAYFIAGWSFRLSHFGTVFVWDFVTFRSHRFTPAPDGNKVFLARKTEKAPARSYGRLSREQGGLVLKYRPWLVFPSRTLTLPAGDYAVGHGLIYSEISRVDGENLRPAILLPPRYRGHEEKLSEIYQLCGVREVGFRAMMRWLRQALGFKSSAPAPAAPPPVPA